MGICNFPGFSQGQNAVIDRLRCISKAAYVVICIRPSFSKAPHAASCQLLAEFVTFQEPQPKTSGPRDQRTRGLGDQGTRGPGDQGPGYQSRVYGTKPRDQGASPNSRAQAEPTLGKNNLGPVSGGLAKGPLCSSSIYLDDRNISGGCPHAIARILKMSNFYDELINSQLNPKKCQIYATEGANVAPLQRLLPAAPVRRQVWTLGFDIPCLMMRRCRKY